MRGRELEGIALQARVLIASTFEVFAALHSDAFNTAVGVAGSETVNHRPTACHGRGIHNWRPTCDMIRSLSGRLPGYMRLRVAFF